MIFRLRAGLSRLRKINNCHSAGEAFLSFISTVLPAFLFTVLLHRHFPAICAKLSLQIMSSDAYMSSDDDRPLGSLQNDGKANVGRGSANVYANGEASDSPMSEDEDMPLVRVPLSICCVHR